MNNQSENKEQCTLSNEELIEKSREWISKLCETGGKAWTLRVPVDLNRDPDILFSELCSRLSQLPAHPVEEKEGVREETPQQFNFYNQLYEKLRKFPIDAMTRHNICKLVVKELPLQKTDEKESPYVDSIRHFTEHKLPAPDPEKECEHPYHMVYRKCDYEKCTKCGKILCEG